MICAQMFTNNDRLLRNSPSLPQFKIRSADQGRISLLIHDRITHAEAVTPVSA